MKQENRKRLTLIYLTIIMTLSLGFSIVFYKNSMDAANRGLNRQMAQLRERIKVPSHIPIAAFDRIRDNELNSIRRDLIGRLFILNSAMLIGGGILSLYLSKKSLEPLEEALENQSRFSSDASHELRTPLTSIKTEIEVALRSKNLTTKEAKEVLNSTLEEINELDTLTTALLRLSTYDQNLTAHDKVQLGVVINKAYERVAKLAKQHEITFKLPTTKLNTLGDKDQLAEVFVVLFDNAIKYGNDKSVVNVTVEKQDNKILVKVTDQGTGILPVDIQHVFDRFYRADNSRSKKNTSGHGLGLSLAKTIIEAHKGTIAVESEIDKGTTFIVSLPAI